MLLSPGAALDLNIDDEVKSILLDVVWLLLMLSIELKAENVFVGQPLRQTHVVGRLQKITS
jgi:hypothetical protein